MKHKLLTTITAMLITALAFAQAPQGMNYQATVRDNNGNAITSHAVGFKFNIRQGSGSGTVVYAETQTPTSDQFGGVALVIGNGTVVSGSFSAINWASGTYFNEVLIDVSGGTNYVSMGASQLMSVPYALYAKNAGANSYTVKFNGVSITDASINHVYAGQSLFLTEQNYSYLMSAPNVNTFNEWANIYYTTDTVNSSNVYIESNIGNTQGSIMGVLPNGLNGVTGIYYLPANSTPVTVNLYQWWGSYWVSHNNVGAIQLLPNNPSVTGFNLTFPVNVTIER